MKLKISDEELEGLQLNHKMYGLICLVPKKSAVNKNSSLLSDHDYKRVCRCDLIKIYNEGFRAAESHHQSTVDKLTEIISKMKSALNKISKYENIPIYLRLEERPILTNDFVNQTLVEVERMKKELNQNKG